MERLVCFHAPGTGTSPRFIAGNKAVSEFATQKEYSCGEHAASHILTMHALVLIILCRNYFVPRKDTVI